MGHDPPASTRSPAATSATSLRRAAGFAGFSRARRLGRARRRRLVPPRRRRDRDVAAAHAWASPGGSSAWAHRAPLVFNIQDVFPDAAVETGAITNRRVIAVASWLERVSYRLADAVTVLSDDLRANVVAKLPAGGPPTVHTIPNFVDTERIRPGDRMTPYRAELGIGAEPVRAVRRQHRLLAVARAALEAARRLPARDVPDQRRRRGAAPTLERRAAGLANVRFAGYVPEDRLAELLATGDVHAVPLRRRAGRGQRAVEDVLDPRRRPARRRRHRPRHRGAAHPRRRRAPASPSPPDDPIAFVAAVGALVDDPERAAAMGARGPGVGRRGASPAAVAAAYERLVDALTAAGVAGPRSTGGAAGRLPPSWFPHRRPRRPPAWPRRARARRSASRAAPCSRCVVLGDPRHRPRHSSSTPAPAAPDGRRLAADRSTTTGTSPTASTSATPRSSSSSTAPSRRRTPTASWSTTTSCRTGVHSHDDGVIHWHPYTSAAVGQARHARRVPRQLRRRARPTTRCKFPRGPDGGKEYIEGETKCGRRGRRAAVAVWDSSDGHERRQRATSPTSTTSASTNDGMVFTIAFVPEAAPTSRSRRGPPNLAELGAVDQRPGRPDDHRCPAARRRPPWPRRAPARPAPARSSAPPTPRAGRRRRPPPRRPTTGG